MVVVVHLLILISVLNAFSPAGVGLWNTHCVCECQTHVLCRGKHRILNGTKCFCSRCGCLTQTLWDGYRCGLVMRVQALKLVLGSNICIYWFLGCPAQISLQWALISPSLERSVFLWPQRSIWGASSCWDVGLSHQSPLSFACALCTSSCVSQQRSGVPAVFVIADPKELTVGQFCTGRKEQSCLWPSENLAPSAASGGTLGAGVRGILWAAPPGWSCLRGSDTEKS